MTSPCTEDGCGVALSITADGLMRGDSVISTNPCNALSCIEGLPADGGGLYIAQDESLVQAGTMPEDGLGWTADLTDLVAFPVGVTKTVAESAALSTFTNESTCLSSNMTSVVTAREVLYDGDATAAFEVIFQLNPDGFGYSTMFRLKCDFRWPAAPPGGISDARAGGARADGRVLVPSGFYSYKYRILLTNLVDPGVGPALVTSPGLTFVHQSTTN